MAAAAPAAPAHERPFKLTEHGIAVFDGLHLSSRGEGQATHLGRFTLTREADLSNPKGGLFDVTGAPRFYTAAKHASLD